MISQAQVIGSPCMKSWDDYERGCLATFGGGHHNDGHLEAFQHGMQTVFELLRREFPPAEVCKSAKQIGGGDVNEINDGGPAFPMCPDYDASASGVMRQVAPGEQGMSLRDWFAGMSLAGMHANGIGGDYREMAVSAYANADAMLAEREKRRG